MGKTIEVNDIEISEYCKIDIETGKKEFYKGYSPFPRISGLYFKDEKTFFALYPTEKGPMMYYEEVEYPLHKNLHINLVVTEPWRTFSIEEYGIYIRYRTSKYLGFDVWSEEEDVDLFYQIMKYYKDDEFYKKYTADN